MNFNNSLTGVLMSTSTLAATVALWVVTCSTALAQSQLVACDLMDAQLATTIVQSPIERYFPNREVRLQNGAVKSVCLLTTSRILVFVELSEYSSPADAARALQEHVSPSLGTTYSAEKRFGDEGYWWSLRTESHGFVVRKGKRLLNLRTNWRDSITSAEAKARLTPVMPSILSKL